MTLRFEKPSLKYVEAFAQALEEGPFTYMALGGHGDISTEDLRADPEGYIELVNSSAPRVVKTSDGQEFTLKDHEIIWVLDNKDRFIGGVSLRFDQDCALIDDYAGHAGMSVRHGLIGKGYGVKAAIQGWQYVLEQAKKRGLSEVRASADPDNPNSWRLIKHLGGECIREVDLYGWGPAKLYSIDLNKV